MANPRLTTLPNDADATSGLSCPPTVPYNTPTENSAKATPENSGDELEGFANNSEEEGVSDYDAEGEEDESTEERSYEIDSSEINCAFNSLGFSDSDENDNPVNNETGSKRIPLVILKSDAVNMDDVHSLVLAVQEGGMTLEEALEYRQECISNGTLLTVKNTLATDRMLAGKVTSETISATKHESITEVVVPPSSSAATSTHLYGLFKGHTNARYANEDQKDINPDVSRNNIS